MSVDYRELANGTQPVGCQSTKQAPELASTQPANAGTDSADCQSTKQAPKLASGKGKLADDISTVNHSIEELIKLDPSLQHEMDLGKKRAHTRFALSNSVEQIEYQRLCMGALADRIEAENAKFQAIAEASLSLYIKAHKEAGERLSNALEQQQEIALQLPPYSSMA